MKMTTPKALTPSRLRIILLAALVLIAAAGIGIFYLAYGRLNETATAAGQSAASAREGEDTLQRLQLLRGDLDEKRDIIQRTSQVVANSQNYAYQDRLVSDLTIYANRANLSIRNINFSAQAASAPPTGSEGEGAAPAAASGLKTATVDISLDNPVNYQDLLNFLHYVEQNLTKLKVSRVSMTSSEGAGSVTIDALNLEVHVR